MKKEILITAIVITKNEEARIGICLEALSWADEILLIDNGSTDQTPNIAKKYKATIVSAEDRDFSTLRNIGLSNARGVWVLYVDADEVVTDDLQKEIRAIAGDHGHGNISAYRIPRINYYLGKRWPKIEHMERLFLRRKLRGWHGELHESPSYDGDVSTLEGALIHTTHRTLAEMVQKTNEWSEVEARLRYDAGHPPIVSWRLFRVMISGFWDSYIRQQGWKAGTVGLIESIYQAFSMFITYAKLWEKQQKNLRQVKQREE